jgi:hypothetical protein
MSDVRSNRQEQVATQRRRRDTTGPDRNLKLHVPAEAKDPDFEYRFINNRPGRVQQLTKMDDYDIVSAADVESKSIGTTVERIGNSRDGESMILVRKPKAYHEADRAKAWAKIDATEDAMRRAAPASPEGLSGPTAYVPSGKNTINGR